MPPPRQRRLFDGAAIALALVGVTLVARPLVFGGGAGESRGVAPAIALCGSTFPRRLHRDAQSGQPAAPARAGRACVRRLRRRRLARLLIPGQGIDGAAAVDGMGWACAVGVGLLATSISSRSTRARSSRRGSAMARTIDVPAAFGWQVLLR